MREAGELEKEEASNESELTPSLWESDQVGSVVGSFLDELDTVEGSGVDVEGNSRPVL